jgi:hypothetical protein
MGDMNRTSSPYHLVVAGGKSPRVDVKQSQNAARISPNVVRRGVWIIPNFHWHRVATNLDRPGNSPTLAGRTMPACLCIRGDSVRAAGWIQFEVHWESGTEFDCRLFVAKWRATKSPLNALARTIRNEENEDGGPRKSEWKSVALVPQYCRRK